MGSQEPSAGSGGAPRAGFIRPFILTGGRTSVTRPGLRWETLVEALHGRARIAKTTEQRAVLSLAAQPISIAELSSYIHLPTQVVVIVVGDLLDMGAVRIHQTDPVEIELSALTRMIERVRAL
ncbi:MAG TPA: DUF742 domain-containing protein [Acidimicrobiales bacterium]|nr:DUF742 domain-containing protein [Acidimicrobiales bacterium]